MPVSPDESPFAGTAPFYARYRAPYARAGLHPVCEVDWLTSMVGCALGKVSRMPKSNDTARQGHDRQFLWLSNSLAADKTQENQ